MTVLFHFSLPRRKSDTFFLFCITRYWWKDLFSFAYRTCVRLCIYCWMKFIAPASDQNLSSAKKIITHDEVLKHYSCTKNLVLIFLGLGRFQTWTGATLQASTIFRSSRWFLGRMKNVVNPINFVQLCPTSSIFVQLHPTNFVQLPHASLRSTTVLKWGCASLEQKSAPSLFQKYLEFWFIFTKLKKIFSFYLLIKLKLFLFKFYGDN